MRHRINKSEPCYIVRHNENCEIFGVNLISYDERSKIARKKKERIMENNKKKEESKEKFFSCILFGALAFKPMAVIDRYRDIVKIIEENIPSMTV